MTRLITRLLRALVLILPLIGERAATAAGTDDGLELPLIQNAGHSNAPAFCRIPRGATLPVTALAFGLDGKTLYAGGEREIQVWDLVNGRLEKRLVSPVFKGRIQVLARDPSGHALAVGEGAPGSAGAVHFLDLTTGKIIGAGPVAKDVFYALAFSPGGQWLAAGSADATIQIWDRSARTNVVALKEHTERVTSLAFSSNRLCLASASADGSLLLWDTADWKTSERISQGGPVQAAQFNASGEWLAWAVGGASERWVRSRKMDYANYGANVANATNLIAATNTFNPAVEAQALAPTNAANATNLAKAAPPPKRNANRPVFSLDTRKSMPVDLIWNAEGKRLFVAGDDGSVKIVTANAGTLVTNLTASSDWFYRVATDPDGALLAAAGADGAIRLWQARTYRLIATLVPIYPRDWCVLTPAGFYQASRGAHLEWLDEHRQAAAKTATTSLADADKVRAAFAPETEGKK